MSRPAQAISRWAPVAMTRWDTSNADPSRIGPARLDRSLSTGIAGADGPCVPLWFDRRSNQLRRIVSVARWLSRFEIRNAALLRGHGSGNETGRHPAS